jgi:hypothetical protein
VSPTLLFLDEPTSGLDSAAAFHVTAVLRRLASGGRTVLAVIHQPASEVFEQFDLLAMLASGSPLYFGAASGAAPFFEATLGYGCPVGRSAADHLLHCVNADFGDADEVVKHVMALTAAYGGSAEGMELSKQLQALKDSPGEKFVVQQDPPSAVMQTAVLTQRAVAVNLRDLGVFGVRVVMYIGLCLMIGFIYFRCVIVRHRSSSFVPPRFPAAHAALSRFSPRVVCAGWVQHVQGVAGRVSTRRAAVVRSVLPHFQCVRAAARPLYCTSEGATRR